MISMSSVKLPNTNISDTSSHRLVFVLLGAVIYNKQCHVIKHIENFSGDFTFLASWPSGRACVSAEMIGLQCAQLAAVLFASFTTLLKQKVAKTKIKSCKFKNKSLQKPI